MERKYFKQAHLGKSLILYNLLEDIRVKISAFLFSVLTYCMQDSISGQDARPRIVHRVKQIGSTHWPRRVPRVKEIGIAHRAGCLELSE
jgi:hypothetical protein